MSRSPGPYIPLAPGTTYAHWTILAYLGKGQYRARCPQQCPEEVVTSVTQMSRQSGCKACRGYRRKHKGSVTS